jgi:4-hydroxy-3-polyprenylbenzoate decarboxylase
MPAFGGKMGIDATRKGPSEGQTREWPKRLVTTEAAARKADALWEKIRNRDVKR